MVDGGETDLELVRLAAEARELAARAADARLNLKNFMQAKADESSRLKKV